MKLLGTGLTGLVGSRLVELLSFGHTFVNYSLDTGVDITNRDDITSRIRGVKDAPWVLHLAAYTNVQQAEKDRALGKRSDAWRVNVLATGYIVEACRQTGKRLLYVDTDYAFDGTKKGYTEEDVPHPLGWYAITKSEGAKRVATLGENGLTIRISNPYRAHPVGKKDFVHKMLERLTEGLTVVAPKDQLFVPTFVDDIAAAIGKLLSIRASGIYHVVGSQAVSPFEAAKRIAQTYDLDSSLVKATTFAQYFANRAPTPQYVVLSNEKIRSLGVSMRSFTEGIAEVWRQEQQAS
jgi:dTDP-4-dehydrorhamnose reductase